MIHHEELKEVRKDGAEGETRTPTGIAHCPLKTACLPVSPLRLFRKHIYKDYQRIFKVFFVSFSCMENV